MSITAILILTTDCVLLLPQLVTGTVGIHLVQWWLNARICITWHYIKCFVTRSQTQLGFKLNLSIQRAGSLPTKPSRLAHDCLRMSKIYGWHSGFISGSESTTLTPHGRQTCMSLFQMNLNTMSAVAQEDHHQSSQKTRWFQHSKVICLSHFYEWFKDESSVQHMRRGI